MHYVECWFNNFTHVSSRKNRNPYMSHSLYKFSFICHVNYTSYGQWIIMYPSDFCSIQFGKQGTEIPYHFDIILYHNTNLSTWQLFKLRLQESLQRTGVLYPLIYPDALIIKEYNIFLKKNQFKLLWLHSLQCMDPIKNLEFTLIMIMLQFNTFLQCDDCN